MPFPHVSQPSHRPPPNDPMSISLQPDSDWPPAKTTAKQSAAPTASSAIAAGASEKSPYSTPPYHHHYHHQPTRFRSPLLTRLDSSTAWLIYYFAFNLGLTIFNKHLLISFPFPWTLTAIHTLSGTVGSQLAHSYGLFTAARLSPNHTIILVAFSILYTVNIAVSNLSLHLVTVPFHQVVRATTPLFTIILSIIWFNKSYPYQTYLALLIVVIGVGLSTYGDYGWTKTGLVLTLFGTILASFKTVVTNAIQVGRLRLNPLDLLMRMSPLAFFQCILYAYLTGELDRVNTFSQIHLDRRKTFGLLVNGIIAFGLNIVSFTANKKTSALTMTVAANVKQVLTILLAIIIFKLEITPMNFLGIFTTLIGGGYYAKIELDRKYSSKIKDVLIIPNNDDEHDNNINLNMNNKHHDDNDQVGLINNNNLGDHHHQSLLDHPFNFNSLTNIKQQRSYSSHSLSDRELEEGTAIIHDHPILKISSPR